MPSDPGTSIHARLTPNGDKAMERSVIQNRARREQHASSADPAKWPSQRLSWRKGLDRL
jgi:hypothetical protein